MVLHATTCEFYSRPITGVTMPRRIERNRERALFRYSFYVTRCSCSDCKFFTATAAAWGMMIPLYAQSLSCIIEQLRIAAYARTLPLSGLSAAVAAATRSSSCRRSSIAAVRPVAIQQLDFITLSVADNRAIRSCALRTE